MSHRSRGRHAVRRGGFLPHTPVAPACVSSSLDAEATAQTATIPGLDLAPGHMRLRPGMPYSNTLLGCVPEPGERLGEFAVGRDARVVIGDKLELGRTGRIVRVAPFRKSRPIGLRLDGDAWGPIAWYDEVELQLLPLGVDSDADTTELAAAGTAVSA